MEPVRVRFAPSPTGYLHVGGLRTALYNYLLAKRHHGSFILRIEDTDQTRKVEGAVENLISSLEWAGIEFDEGPGRDGAVGPYVQSQRLSMYKKFARELVDAGKAYYCFCTPERLEQVREKAAAEKRALVYDRHCREIPAAEAQARVDAGEPHVVRMKVPLEGEVTFEDQIRSKVTIANAILDDQVLVKSDGFPTYHMAVVVDDHAMGITHVIRGEEWLPSTPKHILLYQFFGWNVPKFAHLPLLLNPDGSKLSKRQGDVAVEDYRAKGYLKEALVNFIAFLGWNPGDTREIFSMQELIDEFSIDRVGKSGAIFNLEKLQWLNQQHIRVKPEGELLELVRPMFAEKGWTRLPDEYLKRVIGFLKDRITVIPDFGTECIFFYEDPVVFEEKGRTKNWGPDTPKHMALLLEKYEAAAEFTAAETERLLRQTAEELGIGAGKLIHPLRLASTGVSLGPSLFHVLELLGRETTLRRLRYALETMK
ncbi:MAG TPA: glutamate--tRNA ligase [Bacteroidota bacterium]|nr:glutamate--tRNA ligase [Bacteroidota bacterium]